MKKETDKQEHPAVLVSIYPAGEADSIVRLFGPGTGGFTARARGLSKPASKLAPGLKPAAELGIGTVSGRGGYPLLTGVSVKRDHPVWRAGMALLALYWFFAECAAVGSGESEANASVYRLLVNLLRTTPSGGERYGAAAVFCLKLLGLHGLLPDLAQCNLDGHRLAADEPAFLLPGGEGLVGRDEYNRLYARTGGGLLRLSPARRNRWLNLLTQPLLEYAAAGSDRNDAAVLISFTARTIADMTAAPVHSADFLAGQWKLPSWTELVSNIE